MTAKITRLIDKDIGRYTILSKWSKTLWYSKSKSGMTREYHWFKLAYLVHNQGRRVGFLFVSFKFMFFVGWIANKKLVKQVIDQSITS